MHLKRKQSLLITVILETFAFEKFLKFAKCVSEGFLIKKGYLIERIYKVKVKHSESDPFEVAL